MKEDETKRVKTHTKLTPEKMAELREARRLEEEGRKDPAIQAEHIQAFEQIEAKQLIQNLVAQLAQAQKRQHLTYADLEAKTGINRSNISRLFSGNQPNTTLQTILRIASALNKRVEITLR